MIRTLLHWVSTSLLVAMALFAAYGYLSGTLQAVQNFTHIGYPQQLRIILGIANLLGAVVLVVPGLARLKEWAYAGFSFVFLSAFVAHFLANDGRKVFMPLVLQLFLVVSYVSR